MGNLCSSTFIIDVEIPDQPTIPVTFPNINSLTVDTLKDEVWRTIRIEKSHQLFSFNGELLSESKNLTDYGILFGDSVLLITIPALNVPTLVKEYCIYVQLQSGNILEVTVPYIHTAKIVNLKECIQYQNGIPQSQQILTYAGKQLYDYRTLKGYGIAYGDVLFLLLLPPVEFPSRERNSVKEPASINVTLPSGRTLAVDVANVSTFKTDNIRTVISGAAHIPVSEQLFVFKGSVLEDNHFLKHYGIRQGDSLDLIRLWYEPRSFSSDINKLNSCKAHVTVILHTGKFMNLTYASVDSFTIELIKQVIHEKEDVPVGQQKLFFLGKHLRDYHSLRDYGIGNDEELHLVVLPPGHMLLPESDVTSGLPNSIDVILPSGNKLLVNIPDIDTYRVSSLRGPVMSIIDAPEENQKYSFKGKLLHDYPSLSDYGIHYGDSLHLTLLHPTKRIYISGSARGDLTILVPDLDIFTILDVKEAISKQEGTSPGHIWLTFSGKALRNTLSLLEYGVGYGDTLHMEAIPKEDIFQISDLVRLASFHEAIFVGGHNVILGPLSRKIQAKLGYRIIGATLRGQDIGKECNLSSTTHRTWFMVVVDAVESSSRNVIEATLSGIKLTIFPLRN